MDKKIIFGKFNFNYIYILLYIIALFINIEINITNYIEVPELVENYKLLHKVLYFYIAILSNVLVIIPILIKMKCSKKNKEENIIHNSNLKDDTKQKNLSAVLIYNDSNKNEIKKRIKIIIFYCFLTGVFNFLLTLMEILFYIIYPNKEFEPYIFSSTVPLDNILQFITSYFILKIYFYKLQYFSLSINIIIFIIILIIDILNIIYNNSFEPIIFLFYPFYLIFSSLSDVFGKKAILYGFISIYTLMDISGGFTLILTIILSLIIFNQEFFVQLSFFFSETKYIILIIVNIITIFLELLFYWLIIDRFNPNYIPFVIILAEFCYYIDIKAFHPEDYKIMGWDEYFRLFLYIILFIGVMIHNEIIIINICGLASETKYFLDLKVNDEEQYTNSNDDYIINRYETNVEMEQDIQVN